MKAAKWEYRVERVSGEQKLNELGAEGWEVIGVTEALGDVVLKRPALDFREQVTLDQRRRYFGYWGLDVPEDQEA